MFGISGPEFLVILLVAIVILPGHMWPDVARFLARFVRFVRQMIWKITDASEQIKTQIELERPIDELIKTTTDDVLKNISSPRKPAKTSRARKK